MVTFEGSAVEGTLAAVSNGDGEIVMRLPYGEYLVTAMIPGMQTIKEEVQIATATTHHTFDFRLADDEEVLVVGMVGASDGSLDVLFDGVPDDAIDDEALSELFDAISERDFYTTRELLNEGVDPNGRSPGGLSPLMMAAYYCDYDIHGDISDDSQATVDALVATGAQVDASTDQGVSVLTFAVYASPPDLVRQLIGVGADVSASDHRGRTAVMMAARSGRTEVLNLLLEAEPDLQARDDQGWTALTYALHFGHGVIVEELLDRGARWRGRDNAGLTALHHAAQSNLVDVCQRLISEGAHLEERDSQGRTPFLMAAEYHQTECLQLLLERGASMWTRDDHDRNALDLARHDFEGSMDTEALQWLKARFP